MKTIGIVALLSDKFSTLLSISTFKSRNLIVPGQITMRKEKNIVERRIAYIELTNPLKTTTLIMHNNISILRGLVRFSIGQNYSNFVNSGKIILALVIPRVYIYLGNKINLFLLWLIYDKSICLFVEIDIRVRVIEHMYHRAH